jgi:hypothetical protein
MERQIQHGENSVWRKVGSREIFLCCEEDLWRRD